MKQLFLSSIPSPYRVDFYNALNEKCDLEVWFEARRDPTSHFNWREEDEMPFSHRYFSPASGAGALHLKMLWAALKWAIHNKVKAAQKRAGVGQVPEARLVLQTYHTRTQTLLIVLLRLLGIPYWFETDGGLINYGERPLSRRIKRFLIGGASGWYSPSRVSDEYLTYYGADAARIRRYHFTSIRQEEVAAEPIVGNAPDALRIVAVGQFIRRKGFDILLKAMPGLTATLDIVGGTPPEEYLALRHQLGLDNQVRFVGFETTRQLLQRMRQSDVFVLPTREDIWGLVINEAMAQGLPVVTTTRCGAGLEMLSEEVLVPIEDVETLHRVLERLLTDTQWRRDQAQRNLDVARLYTVEQMAQDHVKVKS